MNIIIFDKFILQLAINGKLGHIAESVSFAPNPITSISDSHMIRKIIFTLLLTGLTAACSGDDEYIFEHGPAGPNTEKTLETLPKGLQPDKTKANHTTETLEPDDSETN